MKRKRRKFTKKFKEEAVKLVVEESVLSVFTLQSHEC